MRNLKKVLSLALALVMLLGMMVVGAGAVTTTKDYTDGASVNYTEAVDVMSAIGVFGGTGNNQFTPNGNLTRAQAAKIITYMLLGKEAAEKLGTLTAPFADVPAGNWAAGSIAYCSNMGIVSGIGNNKFNPDGLVTGYQFAKMLLVALGYDAEREGLTGKDWSINVSRLALTAAGLDTGMDRNTEFSLDKVLTREEACQMAFNTIKATMVQYATESTSITVAGTPIVIGGSNATAVPVVNQAYGGNISEDVMGGDKDDTIEFGERYFQTLYCNPDTDVMGRPSHTWQVGREDIGTYANTAVFTYTNDCTGGPSNTALVKALANYKFASGGVDYVINGLDNTKSATLFDFDPEATTDYDLDSAAKVAQLTGNGVLVEVYADNNRNVTKVVVINTYLMVVKKVTADEVTLAKVGSIGEDVEAVKKDDVNYAALSALKTDDYVLIVPAYDKDDKDGNPVYVVNAAAVPEVANGALTRVDKNNSNTVTTGVTVAGTSYSIAKRNTSTDTGTALNALTRSNLTSITKKDAILYLDTYGYAVLIEDVVSVTNYMLVTSAYQTLINNKVVTMLRGVSSTGETVEINVGSLSAGNTTLSNTATDVGDLITYSAASSEQANLYGAEYTADEVDEGSVAGKWADLSGYATTAGHLSDTTEQGSFVYSGDVKFIYFNQTNGTLTILDGVQTKATTVAAKALLELNAAGTNTLITAVFIAGDAPTSTPNVLYVNRYNGADTLADGSRVTMWEVFIDGVKKTINVKGAPVLDTTIGEGQVVTGTFYAYGYDEANDLYTLKLDAAYVGTGAATCVAASATLTDVVDRRLIELDDSGSYLNAKDAVIVDLRPGGKITTMRELADQSATTQFTVAVVYNDKSGDKNEDLVNSLFILNSLVTTTTYAPNAEEIDTAAELNALLAGGMNVVITGNYAADAALTVDGANLTVQGNLTASNKNITIDNNATLTVTGNVNIGTGTITVTAGDLDATGKNITAATVTVTDGEVKAANITGDVDVATAGKVTSTGAIDGNLTVTGAADVTAASIDWSDTITSTGLTGNVKLTGTTAIADIGTQDLKGNWEIAAPVTVGASSALTVTGNVTLKGALAITTGGSVTIAAAGKLDLKAAQTAAVLEEITGGAANATLVVGANSSAATTNTTAANAKFFKGKGTPATAAGSDGVPATPALTTTTNYIEQGTYKWATDIVTANNQQTNGTGTGWVQQAA